MCIIYRAWTDCSYCNHWSSVWEKTAIIINASDNPAQSISYVHCVCNEWRGLWMCFAELFQRRWVGSDHLIGHCVHMHNRNICDWLQCLILQQHLINRHRWRSLQSACTYTLELQHHKNHIISIFTILFSMLITVIL